MIKTFRDLFTAFDAMDDFKKGYKELHGDNDDTEKEMNDMLDSEIDWDDDHNG